MININFIKSFNAFVALGHRFTDFPLTLVKFHLYIGPMSPDDRLDPSTRARMAAKDMLRGLRHELERLKASRPITGVLPLRPADALHGLIETVDKIASAGEHFARDLLFTKRDQSRYADFFDPRAALANDPEAGHRFVRSRYAALKLVMARLSQDPVLISESKIAEALASLPIQAIGDPSTFEAQFTLALAHHLPITNAGSDHEQKLLFNRLAALIVGLGGVVAAHEVNRDARDLPDLISLCIEIVKLREQRLLPIFDGPAADIILASIFDELADALKDF